MFSEMQYNSLLALCLVPVFVLVLQKYIEIRASYSPPSDLEIARIEKSSTVFSVNIVKMIPTLRILVILFAILLLYVFAFSDGEAIRWSSIVGVSICILAMSILVNWRMIFDL